MIESSTISISINSFKTQLISESIETTIQMDIIPDENEPIKKTKLEEESLIEQVLIKTPTQKSPKPNENEQIEITQSEEAQSEQVLAETINQIETPLEQLLIESNIQTEAKTEKVNQLR